MKKIAKGGALVHQIPDTRTISHDYSLRNSDILSTFNGRTER